nr:hypothetical protein GCM10020185_45140 [Pseudomonas brassicacearum subsp. brassicacearum]
MTWACNGVSPLFLRQLRERNARFAQSQLTIDKRHLLKGRAAEGRTRLAGHGQEFFSFSASQACCTAVPTDDTVNEPPCSGAVGSDESPPGQT